MLIAVIIIAIAVFGYWYSTRPTTNTSATALQSATGQVSPLEATDTAISDKFLALLLNMKTIKLDQGIFTDTAFTTLRDFSTTIAPETNPGRNNPFAPIGLDSTATQAVTVTTGTAIAVTKNSATFVGALPVGSVTAKRYFEYGTTANTPLGSATAGVPMDAATGSFTFNIVGLQPNTTYYVRAAAITSLGTTYGQVTSFKTLAQ